MYKLLVEGTKVFEGSSLMLMIRELNKVVTPDSTVEIWQRKKTQWVMIDGGIWKEIK